MTRTPVALLTALLVLLPAVAGCADVADVAAGGAPTTSVVRSEPAPDPEPEPVVADEASDPESEEPAEEPEPEEPEAPVRADLTIGDSGFSLMTSEYDDATHYLSYAVLVTNPNTDTHVASWVDVNISFVDDAGAVVATETDTLAAVLPGQTVALGDTMIDGPPTAAAMDVQLRVDSWEEVEGDTGAFEVRDVNHASGEMGTSTTGTIVSTFAEDLESVEAVAVYRDADGAVIGGDFTYADFVPAGGEIGVEVRAYEDVPGVAAAEVYVALTSLSLLD